jgi:hypothetical protein
MSLYEMAPGTPAFLIRRSSPIPKNSNLMLFVLNFQNSGLKFGDCGRLRKSSNEVLIGSNGLFKLPHAFKRATQSIIGGSQTRLEPDSIFIADLVCLSFPPRAERMIHRLNKRLQTG